jgi:hypothetical protein
MGYAVQYNYPWLLSALTSPYNLPQWKGDTSELPHFLSALVLSKRPPSASDKSGTVLPKDG